MASDSELLLQIRKELTTIREGMQKLLFAVNEAESEVPEKMRRFMNYMHDLHDVKFMYEELGHPVPSHVKEELERCDDRYRQLLKVMHTDGGAFEKVRREMAQDPENRWDHTRRLSPPKDKV